MRDEEVVEDQLEGDEEEIVQEEEQFVPDTKTIDWYKAQIAPQSSAPSQPAPQYSKEDIERALKVPKVDEQMAMEFFGEDYSPQQLKALQGLVASLSAHSQQLVQYSNRYAQDSFNQRLSPIEQREQIRIKDQFVDTVVKGAPAFSKHKDLIDRTIRDMNEENGEALSRLPYAQQVKLVQERATQTMRSFNPNFDPKRSSTSPSPMASMSSPGSAGGAKSSGGEGHGEPAWKLALRD